MAVVATLADQTTYEAIVQCGKERGRPFLQPLGFATRWGLGKAAYSRVFRRIDAVAFEAAVARWVRVRLGPGDARHLAIDGKCLRGSRHAATPGVHLVTAYAPDVEAVVGQPRVDAKTNEHKAALELLGVLPLRGRVATAAAMFTRRDVCSAVIGRGGDDLPPAKEDQPTLLADIAAAFAKPPASLFPPGRRRSAPRAFDRAREIDKGHGRVEVRAPTVPTRLADYPAPGWPGCAQVFRLERKRRSGGEVEREVVYGITSLPRQRAGAVGLPRPGRAHCGIENGLHGRRDGTLREDASRVRMGSSQVMARLRNLVIYLRTHSGKSTLAAATRYYMCHPEKSVELLSSRT